MQPFNLLNNSLEREMQYNNFLTLDNTSKGKGNHSKNNSYSPSEANSKSRSIISQQNEITDQLQNTIKKLKKEIHNKNAIIEWLKKTTQFTNILE